MPGWYPDPSGQPGRFRHWDGQAWSQETTTDPRNTPAPPPRGGALPASPQPGGRRGRGPLLAAIAALVLAALLLWWLLGRSGSQQGSAPEDHNTSTPTVSAWNETSRPTPTPQPSASEEGNGELTACPDTGGDALPVSNGTLQGGGLTASTVPGWDNHNDFSMRWAHGTESNSSQVMGNAAASWFSVVSLSRLDRADGFTGVQQAARSVLGCFASSSYYSSFTGRDHETQQAVTIGGHAGFHVQAQVHVDDPNFPGIQGDVVDVIVVDTGDPASLGLFVSSYTIGDTTRQQAVETCIASLR